MRKTSLAASLGLACLLSTATIALAADPGTEEPNNWPQYNRTANAWRYSPLDQINKENVGKLSVAWIAQGGDITMGIQETPIVIDGVIYSITSGNKVAALDGKTGQQLWSFEPKLDPLTKKVLFAPYSRGVAVGHGMVFIGTVDGRGHCPRPKDRQGKVAGPANRLRQLPRLQLHFATRGCRRHADVRFNRWRTGGARENLRCRSHDRQKGLGIQHYQAGREQLARRKR